MAGNLSYEHGLPVTLHFTKANVAENATTNLTLASGSAGPIVPTGYAFHAIYLYAASNADLTAGVAVFNVTANTTALSNGPTVTLADTVQAAYDTERVGAEPLTAAKIIGVNIVADANFAPNTADVDAVLVGVFLQA